MPCLNISLFRGEERGVSLSLFPLLRRSKQTPRKCRIVIVPSLLSKYRHRDDHSVCYLVGYWDMLSSSKIVARCNVTCLYLLQQTFIQFSSLTY